MDACLLAIGHGLFAPDANDVLFCLDLKIVVVETGQLHDGDRVFVFLEHVDGTKAADRGGGAAPPIACDICVEGALQHRQCFKRVIKTGEHPLPPWTSSMV